MKRLVLCLLLAACAKHPPPPPDPADAAPVAIADAAVDAPAFVDFTPDASATDDDRKRALASLLAGASPAKDLPENATDPKRRFDPSLRENLTTMTVGNGGLSGLPAVVGDVTIGGTTASVPLTDADRVLAGLRPRFRRCYTTGLAADPAMSGKLTVMADVKANGDVEAVDIMSNTGVSPQVALCVSGALKRTTFNPPGGKGSVLTLPLTFFVPQK